MALRIAYLVNEYPKVSHSFIRREIVALERQGFEIVRIALRGWDTELVDAQDREERARTRYVLEAGAGALLAAAARALVSAPLRFFKALGLALRLGWRAERPLPYHLVYLAEACRIVRWLREERATHVHAHFGTNSAEVALLIHELGGPPYSFTAHGPEEFDKPQFNALAEKVRRARFVVAISSFGRSQLCRWVERAHWPKIKVVHCALESEFYDVAPVPLPPAPRLVCVGRLSYQKGHPLLIEAAARLAERNVPFELVLAGDGPIRGEIEALIARCGLAERVRITGWLSSAGVREQILAARALVLPTFAEGLPVVIMEAMALRRPVLTTFVAGIPELVRPGENGWLFPAGSVDELVAAMQDCLGTPLDQLQRMGHAAHARAVQRHSVEVEAAKLAAHFEECAR